jgi:hypothetical protein
MSTMLSAVVNMQPAIPSCSAIISQAIITIIISLVMYCARIALVSSMVATIYVQSTYDLRAIPAIGITRLCDHHLSASSLAQPTYLPHPAAPLTRLTLCYVPLSFFNQKHGLKWVIPNTYGVASEA